MKEGGSTLPYESTCLRVESNQIKSRDVGSPLAEGCEVSSAHHHKGGPLNRAKNAEDDDDRDLPYPKVDARLARVGYWIHSDDCEVIVAAQEVDFVVRDRSLGGDKVPGRRRGAQGSHDASVVQACLSGFESRTLRFLSIFVIFAVQGMWNMLLGETLGTSPSSPLSRSQKTPQMPR